MKINWKQVAVSEGYISLKKAYIQSLHDIEKHKQRWGRCNQNKEELHERFNAIICRAKCHAYAYNSSIETVLIVWERTRKKSNSYNWDSFYYLNNNMLKKPFQDKLKPIGTKGFKKNIRKDRWYTPVQRRKRMCDFIMRLQAKASIRKKPRWSKTYKIAHKRQMKYLQEKSL